MCGSGSAGKVIPAAPRALILRGFSCGSKAEHSRVARRCRVGEAWGPGRVEAPPGFELVGRIPLERCTGSGVGILALARKELPGFIDAEASVAVRITVPHAAGRTCRHKINRLWARDAALRLDEQTNPERRALRGRRCCGMRPTTSLEIQPRSSLEHDCRAPPSCSITC